MITIRLSQLMEERLETHARRRRQSKASYARAVILKHIEDLEDTLKAERTLRRVRAGREPTYTLDEVAQLLGLDS